jgi:hypothetical protein
MLCGVWIRPSLLLIMALIFYLLRFAWMISFLVALLTLVSRFQEMMESEFQMSMMGELTFFLGIQVKQTKQGTFVHQAKYTKDLMKKFNMAPIIDSILHISPCLVLNILHCYLGLHQSGLNFPQEFIFVL